MDLAMRDAETRLQSGGMLGKNGLSVDGILGRNNKEDNNSVAQLQCL